MTEFMNSVESTLPYVLVWGGIVAIIIGFIRGAFGGEEKELD